jgi:hypothetical protein
VRYPKNVMRGLNVLRCKSVHCWAQKQCSYAMLVSYDPVRGASGQITLKVPALRVHMKMYTLLRREIP